MCGTHPSSGQCLGGNVPPLGLNQPPPRTYPPPQRDLAQGILTPPLWTEWLTDACENITFPYLRWRAVTIRYSALNNRPGTPIRPFPHLILDTCIYMYVNSTSDHDDFWTNFRVHLSMYVKKPATFSIVSVIRANTWSFVFTYLTHAM